jgi:photosystem II stability/assembly factor-like uncharacterized protein
LIADPNNSSVLYSGGYVYDGVSTYVMAVSKSTDAGISWHRDTLTTAYSMCYALAVDRSNSNVVYAGGYTGVYKSTDAGSTWILSSTGLSGTVNDFAIGSAKANTIYAGTSSGVFKSTNAGGNWTNTGCTNVYAVLINPANENEVYAATYTGVFKSTTGGGGWTAMNTGLPVTSTTSLGINANNYLFVGTDGGGMCRWNIMVCAEEQAEGGKRLSLSVQPNPSPGRTEISYQLKSAVQVSLAIYDIQGRLVTTLVRAWQTPGSHSQVWNGLNANGVRVAGGIYFCALNAGGERSVEKLIITE